MDISKLKSTKTLAMLVIKEIGVPMWEAILLLEEVESRMLSPNLVQMA